MNTTTSVRINHRHIITRLAIGHIYQSDSEYWTVMFNCMERVRAHYTDMGLEVVVDEPGGYAYLRQLPDEINDSWNESGLAPLSRILRRTPLSYHQTLLLVLLRERLLLHEQLPDVAEPLYLEFKEISEMLRPFYPDSGDDKKYDERVLALLRRFDALGMVSQIRNRSESIYRVEPIIKARLPVELISEIRKRLSGESSSSSADQEDAENGEPILDDSKTETAEY